MQNNSLSWNVTVKYGVTISLTRVGQELRNWHFDGTQITGKQNYELFVQCVNDDK